MNLSSGTWFALIASRKDMRWAWMRSTTSSRGAPERISPNTLCPMSLESGHQSLRTRSRPLTSRWESSCPSGCSTILSAAYFFLRRSSMFLKTPSMSISRILCLLLISSLIFFPSSIALGSSVSFEYTMIESVSLCECVWTSRGGRRQGEARRTGQRTSEGAAENRRKRKERPTALQHAIV